MRVGIHLGKFAPAAPGETARSLQRIARLADDSGIYSLWVMDHLFQLGEQYGAVHGPPQDPMLEAYTTLGFLAAQTRRIRLGTLVTCEFFRPPGLLLKTLTTLDVLAGGRTYLGIGAGWYEREAAGLGIAMPRTWSERFRRLEETLQLARHMWEGNGEPFTGRYYRLAEPINSPRPDSMPHPPILVGGSGERKTLRLVARYADAANFVLPSPLADASLGVLATPSYQGWLKWSRNRTAHLMAVLRTHCEEAGRSFDRIEKTVVTYVLLGGKRGMSPDEVVELLGELGAMGYEHVILNIHDIETMTPLELLGAEVLPQLAA